MAIVGAAVMVASSLHKRRYFHPPQTFSVTARILLVSAIYFVPASIGWLFVAGFALRAFAESGYAVPAGIASVCELLGVYVLGSLILKDEITEARKAPRRW